jgi:hypothetical protein
VLLATLLGSVILVALLAVFQAGDETWKDNAAWIKLQRNTRQAMEGMTRELRRAESSSVNVSGDGDQIDFMIGNNTVSYYLSGEQILREHPENTTRVLGNDITVLQFDDSDGVITIGMTAQTDAGLRTYSFPLTSKVRLRN